MTSIDVYKSRRSRHHLHLRQNPVASLPIDCESNSDVQFAGELPPASPRELQTQPHTSTLNTATDLAPRTVTPLLPQPAAQKKTTPEAVQMALSSFINSPGRDQWLFEEEDLHHTPSIINGGISMQEEWMRRAKGVNFIIQAGMILKLPQLTLATASVFFHRFYMRESMVAEKGGIHHYVSLCLLHEANEMDRKGEIEADANLCL